MTKTLAELRAERTQTPAERRKDYVELCLKPELLDQVRTLSIEHDNLLAKLPATPAPDSDADEEDRTGPPSRVGGESPAAKKERLATQARMDEILGQLKSLAEEMAEYEGTLTLRANLTDGEWRRWSNANPPRGEDEPGHDRDQRATAGLCDADALIEHLGAFVHEWNSEPITEGDWADVFEPAIGNADKADLAYRVVAMYESRLDFQRQRNALSTSLKRLSGSGSPANSASPTSGSTGGSPSESTAATTETATK